MAAQASDDAAAIEVARNGPYRVRGRVRLRDSHGAEVPAGAAFALCRCGNSSKKPFCDGTHWAAGFDEDRGRRAAVFVPPGGVRRSSLALGGLLVAGTAAAIIALEAAGNWTAPGFLFSGGLIPDLNLALEILLVAGLTFGAWLARRGNIAAHRCNQTTWVLMNAVLIALIMARGMENAAITSVAELAEPHTLVPWVHAALGGATVAAALWLVLQMNGLLPRRLHVRRWKALMRLTLAGYWLVALQGIGIYYLWFLR